jgi:peptidoglycan/xylan/chitin deacetylase (PgdA/CDA1 family)
MATESLATWPAGCRAAVSLSFDDAEPSQLEHAIPLLNRQSLRATFYLDTNKLESLPSHIRPQFLRQWAATRANGHELGNHTRTHPCSGNFTWTRQPPYRTLESLTLADIAEEIAQSQDFFGRELDCRPATFAYPCGMAFVGRGKERQSYVPLVAQTFVVGRGFNGESAASPAYCDLAYVPAISMDSKDLHEIVALIDAAVAEGDWLILVGHRVGSVRAPLTTDVSTLEELLSLLGTRKEVWVDTVAAVGGHLAERRSAKQLDR